MELEQLFSLTRPESNVGIGLVPGDPREGRLREAARFCPVSVFRSPGELVSALERGAIAAAARGSLEAAPFLSELKDRLGVSGVRRIALMVLDGGQPLLLCPVGIDEGWDMRGASRLVSDCREFCSLLGWEPRIGVLSAGRAEDGQRRASISRSIERGERLAAECEDVRHFHITIEEAVGWANCVVAPDGVAGNLLYRALAHLGGARSLGALYFPLSLRLADSSRSGTVEEYAGALALANIAASRPAKAAGSGLRTGAGRRAGQGCGHG